MGSDARSTGCVQVRVQQLFTANVLCHVWGTQRSPAISTVEQIRLDTLQPE
jgi:hypothetical protein